MDMDGHAEREKRTYIRIVYNPGRRPRLTVNDAEFEVTDISEGGIRFLNDAAVELPEFITGTITFLDDETIEIDGNVEWQQHNEVGLSLKYMIPAATIEKEQRHLILNC
ncbi:MAG: PilZ domain-containing protein [Desulfobacterales bacterium]|nr:PilZ domain-containing protein [Desulfobacterales bacterium]